MNIIKNFKRRNLPGFLFELFSSMFSIDYDSLNSVENIQNSLDRHNDLSPRSIFNMQCYNGNLNNIKLLVDHFDVDVKHSEGLLNVCLKGYMDIFEYLVSKGVNILQECGGWNTLTVAIEFENFDLAIRIIQLFTQEQINELDSNGDAPIHSAVMKNSLDIVKQLTIYGADLNKENMFGKTPMMLAQENGHLSIIDYLNGWLH